MEIFGYTIKYYAKYLKPYDADTDGDSILDGEILHVNQYDVVYNVKVKNYWSNSHQMETSYEN